MHDSVSVQTLASIPLQNSLDLPVYCFSSVLNCHKESIRQRLFDLNAILYGLQYVLAAQ